MSVFLTGVSSSYLRLVVVLLIFVFVLAITAFTTKWVSDFQKKQGNSGNLELIEGIRLSPNKTLQIVRVADKYICIAVGKDEVSYLCEVDAQSICKKDNQSVSFSDSFTKALSQLSKNEKKKDIDGKEENN